VAGAGAEVPGLEVDGHVGCGKRAGELVLKLLLALLTIGVFVVGGSVVAVAVFDAEAGAIDFYGESAVASVAARIGGAIAEDVVGGGVVLDAGEGGSEVVGVKEGLAAGVRRERGHDFLGVEVGVEVVLEGGAVVAVGSAEAASGGVAEGGDGLEATGINAVDGEVGAYGGVDGGAQGGLVLDAVALDSAGEVEHGFLLVNVGEGFGDGGDGEELAVGVEVVELALVGGECGCVLDLIGGAGGSGSEALRGCAGVAVDGVEQELLVLGEVLIDGEVGVKGDGGDDVGGLHLFVDVVAGGLLGADDVVGLHGGEVEEEHDEAVVAQLLRRGDGGGVEEALRGLGGVLGGVLSNDGGLIELRGLIDALKVEARDALRLAVFEDGEVFGGEAADDGSGFFVAHDDIGKDEVTVDLEGELRLGGGGLLLRARRDGGEDEGREREGRERGGNFPGSMFHKWPAISSPFRRG